MAVAAQTYLRLDYERLARDYKLSLRRFTSWLSGKKDLTEGFGAMEGEANKYTSDPRLMLDMIGRIMPAIVTNDPRKLYEYFDDNMIRISVCEHPDSTNESPLFTSHNSVTKTSLSAPTRHEAEQNAFYAAFVILENSITPKTDKDAPRSSSETGEIQIPAQDREDKEEETGA